MMLLLPLRRRLAGFAVLLTLVAPAAPAQVLDPAFQPTELKLPFSSFTYITRAVAVQSDGKLVISGAYDYLDGVITNTVRRLNADGSPDPTFQTRPGSGMVGTYATALAVQPNGYIIAAGTSMSYDSTYLGGLQRLRPNGTIDPSFNPGGEGFWTGVNSSMLRSVAVQPDGKILVGGWLKTYNGMAVGNLMRLLPNGLPDPSWRLTTGDLDMPSGNASVETIVVQPDGKILVGGVFSSLYGTTVSNLVRLNSDGSADASFQPGTGINGAVRALLRQPDGKLLVGGYFTRYTAATPGSVLRLNADGSLDTSFQPGLLSAGGGVMRLRLQADGSVLVAGRFTRYGGVTRGGIARLSNTGIVDATFGAGTGSTETVYDLTPLSGGAYLASGAFTSFHGAARTGLARLDNAGVLDASYNPVYALKGAVEMAVPLTNGLLAVQGNFSDINGLNLGTASYALLNPNGSTNSVVTQAAQGQSYIQPDGSSYVINTYSGTTGFFTHLRADGSADPAFATATLTPNYARGVPSANCLVMANSQVLIAGFFSAVNGQPRPGLARLLADGRLDPGFVPTLPWNNNTVVEAFVSAVQYDGKVLVGWYDATATYLARLQTDGSLDTGFANGGILTRSTNIFPTPLPSGKLLISSDISNLPLMGTAYGLVRLNADGSPDPTFVAAARGAVTPQPDGRLLIASLHPAHYLMRVLRLNADGSLDPSFTPITTQAGIIYNGGLRGIALQPTDGKIILFGGFVTVNGQQRVGLARLTNTLLAAQPALPAAPALDLYPNPARTTATLRLPAAPAARPARLLDALGRPVRALTIAAHAAEATVDVAGLPAGVYVLRCGAASRRLVVE